MKNPRGFLGKMSEMRPEVPPKRFKVRRVCAWCGKFLGYASFLSDSPGTGSHGICKLCFKKQEEELRKIQEDSIIF